MGELLINILSPKKLVSKASGKEILELLQSANPDLVPERYGTYEPMREIYDPSNPEKALEKWGDSFLWKHKNPRSEGSVWSSWEPRPQHAWITLACDTKKLNIDKTIQFVTQASSVFYADFSFIHILTQPDIFKGKWNETITCYDPAKGLYLLSVTTNKLLQYLPDIYWGTVLGLPYVELFGRSKLLSAPAFLVQELENGGVYLQISESPLDLETHTMRLARIRQEIKEHLNINAFYDPEKRDDHVYDVPEFHLGID